MPLAAPQLDDRHFQDLVDEAKKRIPHYCKEWTDHNVSDPGVTLIELFAWMTDLLLYRLNQVPDLHYIKFMEMLGIRLQEPEPAHAPVTFWLSAPQPNLVVIPGGTEVASTQTETQPSIIFTTDTDLLVRPAQLAEIYSRQDAGKGDNSKVLRDLNRRGLELGMKGVEVFSSLPHLDDALYFGFENDLSLHILGFDLEFDSAGGAGSNPNLPPYTWEASIGQADGHWSPCEVELDTTRAMNSNGRVLLHTPSMGRYAVNDQNLYWIRARVKEIRPDRQHPEPSQYKASPLLCKAAAATWGGTISATHSRLVTQENLGQSDGTPGQRFHLQMTPILKRSAGEHLMVKLDKDVTQDWKEAPDFSQSGALDCHYLLDSVSGELRLGPAIRQPDGTIKLCGAVPPRKAYLIFSRYRFGGGEEGNVQAGILNTLKTSIPYIDRVANRTPAVGGLDAETLEAAMLRAPALLRARDRAVTESDFEFLATQALPQRIARVRCIQPRPGETTSIAPGLVYVLVIPRIPHPEGYIKPKDLSLATEDQAGLVRYLNERRLLTTRLEVREPSYIPISARVRLHPAPEADRAKVEGDILSRLYRFLNPLTGGADGKGWPFGRDLFVAEVYQCLQGLANVQFIRSVEIFLTNRDDTFRGEPLESVEVIDNAVIRSGMHTVEFV